MELKGELLTPVVGSLRDGRQVESKLRLASFRTRPDETPGMDMEAFLASQKSAGQFESQGAFTMDMEKARQKLSKFQLEDSSFYLLKAVQAAVSGGAARIDLRTSRSKLALWFDASAPLGSFEDLLAALRNPLEAPAGPLKLLALGFNAALSGDPEQVSLVCWDEDGGRALIAQGDELAATAAPERPAGVSDSACLFMFSVVKQKTSWMSSATASEHAAVTKHCVHCPVEFRVDGQVLTGGHQPASPEEWLTPLSLPFHLVERAAPCAGGGVKVRTSPCQGRREGATGWIREKRNAETFCLQPLLRPWPTEVRGDRAYALPLGLRGEDRITFVCHGVTVSTLVAEPTGVGAAAIVNASDLSYDLSGFGLMRDEKFWALVSSVQAVWKEMAQSLPEDLRFLTSTVTGDEKAENDQRSKQGVSCGCLGCLGTVALMITFPALNGLLPHEVLLGVPILAGAVPYLQARPDPHRPLQEAVLRRLDEMRESHWPFGPSSSGVGGGLVEPPLNLLNLLDGESR